MVPAPKPPWPLTNGADDMAAAKGPFRETRSPKAGQPPDDRPVAARTRRRQKSATAAFRKDSTLVESPSDPRARWPASRPKFPKR
jgi:hypothetical protein